MSVVTFPADIAIGYDGAFAWGQQRYELMGMADSGGATQVRLLGPSRWSVSMRSPRAVTQAEAAVWRAFLLLMRGRVNHVGIWNLAEPVPRGTLRGSPRLMYAIAAGATTMTLIGGTAGTLLRGDALQLGSGVGTSQLVHIVADAASDPATSTAFSWDNGGAFTWDNGGAFTWSNDGTVQVTFEPPARIDFAIDTVATWDKPLAYFKAISESTSWSYYSTRIQQGFSFDGIEDWTP